jgi:tRNA-dihydrouridine synthase A
MSSTPAYRISIAPMMDWTDRHCRFFLRRLSKHVLLYTEMVTTNAILRGNREKLLRFDPSEHPIALQLGGADVGDLVECARIGADWGYDEINLNVGCPSDRVQSGRFGACLMLEPDLVARCVEAMTAAVDLQVTIKSRISVDDQDEWPTLSKFSETMVNAGASRHIVHARKAILNGLSPKQNREIPPLRYDLVYRLKEEIVDFPIVLNGGVKTHDEIAEHLQSIDGVMIGREAYRNPGILAAVDRLYFDLASEVSSPKKVLYEMLPYIEKETTDGVPLRAILRHMMGLFHGTHGARAWRRHLSDNAHQNEAATNVILEAMSQIRDELPAIAG